MIPQIEKYVKTNWEKFFAVEPKNLQFLFLGNPQGKKITHGKCTVLIFKNQEPSPAIVCKFLRTKESLEQKITKEHQLLKQLNWHCSPAPIDITSINDRPVSFEQFKQGISLRSILTKKVNKFSISNIEELKHHIADDFEKVTNLINELKDVKVAVAPSTSTYADNSFTNKDFLFELLQFSEKEINMLNELIKVYQNQKGKEHFVHFDFTPSNLLRDNDELSLIDYEFSQVSRHSFLDPLRFCFYYFYLLNELNLLHHGSFEMNFYELFTENNVFSNVIQKFFISIFGEYSKESFFQYMALFLLSNLQLQLEETDFPDENFIKLTRNLMKISLNIIEGEVPNLEDYRFNQVELTFEEIKVELLKKQNEVEHYKAILSEKDQQHEHLVRYIEECQSVIKQKDSGLEENEKYIAQCHDVIQDKDRQLEENIRYIDSCHKVISQKEHDLEEKNRIIEERQAIIEQQKNQLSGLIDEISILKDSMNFQHQQIETLKLELSSHIFTKMIRKIRNRKR